MTAWTLHSGCGLLPHSHSASHSRHWSSRAAAKNASGDGSGCDSVSFYQTATAANGKVSAPSAVVTVPVPVVKPRLGFTPQAIKIALRLVKRSGVSGVILIVR